MHVPALSAAVLSVAILLTACGNKGTATQTTDTTALARAADSASVPAPMGDGTYCFLKTFHRDTTEVTLTLLGEQVSGTMNRKPWEKDAARGTLTGKRLPSGTLDLVYNYQIEGQQQSETKEMQFQNDLLLINMGELVDPRSDGNLVYKDRALADYSDTLIKIPCPPGK